MQRYSCRLAAALLLTTTAAQADVPRVVADIALIHSLVAQVMDGVGTPDLLLPPTASPHDFALRPSDARRLQDAALVVWVGPDLTPWLDRTLDTLAGEAHRLTLLSQDGVRTLPFRSGARFEHDHDHGGHDDHAHAETAAHDHDHDHDHAKEAAAHDHDHDHDHAKEAAAHDHDHDHDHAKEAAAHDHDHDHHEDHAETASHDGHDHGDGLDPHAWLDPANARIWLHEIAHELAEIDPANAARYEANAEAAVARLTDLEATLTAQLADVAETPFIVFHDAYQYFETRFGLSAAGAIAPSDAEDPSAARVAELRDTIVDTGAVCVFSEPQFNDALVETVMAGQPARLGTLDPVGASLDIGAAQYGALITAMAETFETCLSGNGS